MPTQELPIDQTGRARHAAESLRRVWAAAGFDGPLSTAVMLGSGLRRAADDALACGAIAVPYADVPAMPTPRVEGHEGQFVVGGTQLDRCVLLQGRAHLYEGWSLPDVTFCVTLLAKLGIRTLIVTNAAGGIRDGMQPGDLMVITDHLSLVDMSPLSTAAEHAGSVRSGKTVWSPRLLENAQRVDSTLQIHTGCYAMMSGPNYETPAEIRMLKFLGADAVGMSTIPEATTASRLGLEVLGVSCITNAAAGLSKTPLSHREVGETAARVESEFVDWLHRLLLVVNEQNAD